MEWTTFSIEKEILSSMSDEELLLWQKDISWPTTEWIHGKEIIKDDYKLYSMNEISYWFVYYYRYIAEEWEEGEQKQKLSKKISYEIKKRNPLPTTSNFKEVDFNEVPIVELISRYMTVPSHYNKRNIPCPIHREKTGSFRIYEDSNSYHCYGCHSWWWPFQFFKAMEWLDNKEWAKKYINLFFK